MCIDIISEPNHATISPSVQDGRTPLFTACDSGHSNVVEILLDYGANVNQQNDVSKTVCVSHVQVYV